jgi:hypothetical protein
VTEDPVLGREDVTDVGKIGQLHDNIRRAHRRESLYQEISDFYFEYTKWKTRWQNETNVAYSMDVSLLQQWGLPNGGSPALQIYATPSVDWTVFKSTEWGTGSVQLSYYAIPHYPTTQNATGIQSNLGLITPTNDYPCRAMNFAQLSYTQASPDNSWLLTADQYPLSNFDGNAYLGNQQQNFNNFLFSQNATQTYLLTGLGAYLQFNATSSLSSSTPGCRARTTGSARRSRRRTLVRRAAPRSATYSGRPISVAWVPPSTQSRTSSRRASQHSPPRETGRSMRYRI